MRRTFIYQDNTTRRFWDIEVDFETLTTYFGDDGTEPTVIAKQFFPEEHNTYVSEICWKAAEELIAEKLQEGYYETTDNEDRVFLNTHHFKRVTYEEVLSLLNVEKLFSVYDHEMKHGDRHPETNFIKDIYFCDGDLYVTGDLPELRDIMLVVRGNMTITGKVAPNYRVAKQYYVTGNTTVDYLYLGDCQYTGGAETVRYVTEIVGMIDEWCYPNEVRPLSFRRINSPLFICEECDLDSFEIAPHTVITALYYRFDVREYETDNVFLPDHEYAFAFRDELYHEVQSGDKKLMLDREAIYQALKVDKPIWRDGVTTAGIQLHQLGVKLLENGDTIAAYKLFKEAIEKAPGYYLSYHAAGQCLYLERRYNQAKAYYDIARQLAPAKVVYDYGSAGKAALCALIIGQYVEAEAISRAVLDKDDNDTLAREVLGEVMILQGKPDIAIPLLEKAVAIDATFTNNWLLGLAYYLKNDQQQAIRYHDNAVGYYKGAAPYEEQQSLRYYYEGLPTEEIKDQAYYHTYIENNRWRVDEIITNEMPLAFRTQELLILLLKNPGIPGSIIKYFNTAFLTREILLLALQRSQPVSFSEVPDELLTYDVFFKSVSHHHGAYDYVPHKFRDQQMIIARIAGGALNRQWHQEIPDKYCANEYLLQAIDCGIHAITNLPVKLVDIEVYAYAAAKYGHEREWSIIVDRYSRDRWQYGTQQEVIDMSNEILQYGIDIIEQVPAHLINQQRFAFYKKHLGHHPAFTARATAAGWITRRDKKPDQPCPEFDKDTLQQVWACFLDEDYIIKALTFQEGRYPTSIKYVPASCRTKKVCEVAVSSWFHEFSHVPQQLITPEICEIVFAEKDRYNMLEHVPLHMRTKPICDMAVHSQIGNISHVPLVLREPYLFIDWGKTHGIHKDVPKKKYTAVFAFLYEQYKDRYGWDYLLLHWGIGLILDGQYETAREKLKAVKDDLSFHQVQYYIGWSYFLEGNITTADNYFKSAQDLAAQVEEKEVLNIPYASFEVPAVEEVYAWNWQTFSRQFDQLKLLIACKDYEEATTILTRSEQMLTEARCQDIHWWALQWEQQLYVLEKIGSSEAIRNLSLRVIDQLRKVPPKYEVISRALRNAQHHVDNTPQTINII